MARLGIGGTGCLVHHQVVSILLGVTAAEPYLCTKISLIKLCAAWKNFYYSPPLSRSTSSFEAHCLSHYHLCANACMMITDFVSTQICYLFLRFAEYFSVTVSTGMICFKIAILSNDIPLPESSIMINRMAHRAAHSPHRNLSLRVLNQKIKFWYFFLHKSWTFNF